MNIILGVAGLAALTTLALRRKIAYLQAERRSSIVAVEPLRGDEVASTEEHR